MTEINLKKKSLEYRKTILEIIFRSGAGHTGGSLSCVDILNVLYNSVMDISPENFSKIDRDHYIQSKGHSVEALYTVFVIVVSIKEKIWIP
jgi:transketolase